MAEDTREILNRVKADLGLSPKTPTAQVFRAALNVAKKALDKPQPPTTPGPSLRIVE